MRTLTIQLTDEQIGDICTLIHSEIMTLLGVVHMRYGTRQTKDAVHDEIETHMSTLLALGRIGRDNYRKLASTVRRAYQDAGARSVWVSPASNSNNTMKCIIVMDGDFRRA